MAHIFIQPTLSGLAHVNDAATLNKRGTPILHLSLFSAHLIEESAAPLSDALDRHGDHVPLQAVQMPDEHHATTGRAPSVTWIRR
jgi:hypothetical protein